MCLIRFIHLHRASFPPWASISRVYRDVWVLVSASYCSGTPAEALVTLKATYRQDKESFPLSASILSFLPTLTHSSFCLHAGLCHKTQWVFREKLQPREYPSTPSSEISPASHSAWYLCLTFRHKPLRESAGSKCHPFPFINSLSEFAQVTHFPAAAEQ